MTTLKGHMRLIDMRTAGLRSAIGSATEWGEATGVTGTAGEAPTCTVDGDDDVSVIEPYGLAGQPASVDALVLAPEGDTDNLVALTSSVAGRPATNPGDKALWCAGGHVIYLDDDGSLSITSKDGAVIDLPISGGVTITAATGASITINVGVGQSVNVGDALAVPLLKAQDAETFLAAAANAVTGTPDVVAGFVTFAGLLLGLANAAGTEKAKGV